MNSAKEIPDVQIVARDADGNIRDMSVLEENDVAYDPTRMTMDLTKAEKRRTTALMMAVQAYDKLIIKDAEMYNAISRDRERNHGPVIQPATMNAMVEAAVQFDAFIAGRFGIQNRDEVAVPEHDGVDEIQTHPEAR